MPVAPIAADTLPEHPPKTAIPMRKDRIWIDGCFDFTHHGACPSLNWPQEVDPPIDSPNPPP